MTPQGVEDARLLSGATHMVGVIGWPVAHSVSPAMQNAAFQALGLDWCYVPLPVAPGRLREAMAGLVALGMEGANVTVPHKESAAVLVDSLTPQARAIGAVNTLLKREDGLVGHNTDADGFLSALRETGLEPQGCDALVLGAGGAARAVLYALASAGAHITLLNRTLARAEALAREFQDLSGGTIRVGRLEAEELARHAEGAHLVVNTTLLGMWPGVDTSPWPDDMAFPREALLFDLVYNPRDTLFMGQARAYGASAVDGLRMLVHQGAQAFTLWTGAMAPIEVMYRACIEILGER